MPKPKSQNRHRPFRFARIAKQTADEAAPIAKKRGQSFNAYINEAVRDANKRNRR